jgi:choloylglycine hydrolase
MTTRGCLGIIAGIFLFATVGREITACTGITLKAKDGAIVYGRTLEWGSFDLKSRIMVIPRGTQFTGQTPDGKPGKSWKAIYGVAGVDGLEKDLLLDAMNEKGLAVGLFYHPGFASYQKYEPAKAADSMAPTDVGQYLLTTCSTVDEVRAAIAKVVVVPVVEPALVFPAPIHFIVTEPSGKAIVIEYLKGQRVIFEAPLGVITNAPGYDWHEINLRNHVNLSAVAIPDKKIDDMDFKPLGGGSGMIGLPGDFTPPSRFVRAVAFSKTARPTTNGAETIYECFRILDNFNVPLGAAEGSGSDRTAGMRSATIWTTAHNTKDLILYYHTQHNRRVRMIDLKKIDFETPKQILHFPLDAKKAQDIEDVTPAGK